MKFSDKFIKNQIERFRPLAEKSSIPFTRSAQDKFGRLIHFIYRKSVVVNEVDFNGVPGAIVVPRDESRSGIILYLHGGGFVTGGLDYAKGFAAMLAGECGMRVACNAYRLAPENPYPAAIFDALSTYVYLLSHGYKSDSILFAGESAGGGLCFSLCLKLRELGLPMPAGILAISPWCDLTCSGESHQTNISADPSLSRERLEYFAKCYLGLVKDPKADRNDIPQADSDYENKLKDPLVSPVFADLTGLPPTLIFAGGDEILLSDSVKMDEALRAASVSSKLHVRTGMWHAYHLYNLKSAKGDFEEINDFIKKVFPKDTERKLRWMPLDNSAKIYPASRTTRWENVFRISATLKENVDREVLQSALDVTVRRFPSVAVRLRRGTFWYYLEEIAHAPMVKDESAYPLSRMPYDDIRSCAFRVIIYKKRIAVEFFHAITDGNGGLIFLKSLLAEYLAQKHGLQIPAGFGVLDRLEKPSEEELEDCFPKHANSVAASRKDTDSYRIMGDPEPDRFSTVTAFTFKASELLAAARERGVTVTAFLAAAFIKAGIQLQHYDQPYLKRQKHVKVLVPCDLRRIFGTNTLRNFALYATPGVDPRLGDYTFDELCDIVSKQMSLEITKKNMSARIRTNVKDEESLFIKLTPLFLKNIVMRAVFLAVGERKSMLSLSNLGMVKLPEIMYDYIDRFDFILNVQSNAPYNASVISYGDEAQLNIIRNIKEPRLEMALYRVLREENISVKVESNQR